MKIYPHESEAVLLTYYAEYLSNLQNYYYEQQYKLNNSLAAIGTNSNNENPSKKALILAMLEKSLG
jgi:hypothetical protein